MYTFLVNSGTSTTRVRLIKEKQVIDSFVENIGVVDVVAETSATIIEILEKGIWNLQQQHNIISEDITAVILSGMITSGNGVREVPHVNHKISLNEFPLVKENNFKIADCPVFYIPGVKIINENLKDQDMMRGEECEIIGYLHDSQMKDVIFIHYGAHHKTIKVQNNRITLCKTSITGELMSIVMNNSILKNSIIDLDKVEVNMRWVLKGFEQALEEGLGRTLFSARVLDVMEEKSKSSITNFILGALLSVDYEFTAPIITGYTGKIVLYGRPLFPSLFKKILSIYHKELDVEFLAANYADNLSVKGALTIYQQNS